MDSAFIVTDLGYGDAGKGTTVDYLVRKHDATTVVRHNGGAQAAHNVVSPDGRHHTFSQWSSGTFVPGVQTYLSRFMLVNPVYLFAEEEKLRQQGINDGWDRLTIDAHSLITTPFHVAANRIREKARGAGRHGSCGAGIGETMSANLDGVRLYAHQMYGPSGELETALRGIQGYCRGVVHHLISSFGSEEIKNELEMLEGGEDVIDDLVGIYRTVSNLATITDAIHPKGNVIFEGAQGVLLDEWYGFHPYTTWSTCTHENALELIKEWGANDLTRLGVMRSYMTRHGAGPFVTEDDSLIDVFPEPHNKHGAFQGGWRVGYTDLIATEYALKVCGGVDGLVVTHCDRIPDEWRVCTDYVHPFTEHGGISTFDDSKWTPVKNVEEQAIVTEFVQNCAPVYRPIKGEDLLMYLDSELDASIVLESHGPTANDKVDRNV